MKKIWKKLTALALSAALMLPVLPAAQAEEPEGDLMDFAGAVSAMIADYGLESEGGEAGLLDLELEMFSTARLIVKAEGEIDPLNAVSVAEGFRNLHVLQFADPAAAAAAYEVYAAMDGVEYVEPDGIVTLDATTASAGGSRLEERDEAETESTETEAAGSVELLEDDAFLSWGYETYGSEEYDDYYGPYAVYGISMTALQNWAKTRIQRDVVVAVVDSGVMADHEFLRDYILEDGYDFINNDDDPDDDDNHGTHVTGTIVDGTRALGNVKILPVKGLDENGSGSWMAIALCVLYAAEYGADVINMSLGGDISYVLKEAIDFAVESGCTVVAAAGNDTQDAVYEAPACFENVICVAATDQDCDLANYSNYGSVVDVTAPGSGIYSAMPYNGEHDEKYQYMNGTSMATPHVSAVAAILLSVEPDLTPAEVELRLEAACVNPVGNYAHPADAVFPMQLDAAELTGTGTESISISRDTANICPGQEFRLTASTAPEKETIGWESSNPSVAVVSDDGTVTALKEGFAVITATAGGLSTECFVVVQALELTMPDPLQLPVEGSMRVHAVAEDLDPMPELTWSVANPEIAKLYVFSEDDKDLESGPTANGVVIHGLKAGTTTVSASFGSVTKSFTVTVKKLGSWYDTNGADGFAHHIKYVSDLKEFFWAVNCGVEDSFTGHTVYLDNNLNLNGSIIEPGYGFNGTFEGGGKTLSYLTFRNTEYGEAALFGDLDEDGVIRNLNLNNVNITVEGDGSYVAGLVTSNSGLIENCHVTGKVYAPDCSTVGGIAGSSSGVIKNCTNAAKITAHYAAAGIAGEGVGTIIGCSNTGAVEVSGWNTGGIAGYYGGDVTDCSNSSNIKGEDWHLGGVVGYSYGGTVSGCVNSGVVTGFERTGGIVGQSDGLVTGCVNRGSVKAFVFSNSEYGGEPGDAFGGIAGYSSYGMIENCENTGSMNLDLFYVGGILGEGYGAAVVDCRNEAASIIGGYYVGGVVGGMIRDYSGYEDVQSFILGCSNTATVMAEATAGGIVGEGYETAVEYCRNDGDVNSPDAYHVGGIAGSISNEEFHLRDCTNSGAVTGYSYVGGIAGSYTNTSWDGTGAAQLYNCINSGTVSATGRYSCGGGIVGNAAKADIRNCLNTGDVFCAKDAGGLVGYFSDTGLLENCVVQGQVSGENAGLFCGSVAYTEVCVMNCYAEPDGIRYGYAGTAPVESDCSGFYYDNAAGAYVLAQAVTADGQSFTDLIDALNAVVRAEHELEYGYDLNLWGTVDGNRLEMLTRSVRIEISAQEKDQFMTALPWELMDTGNSPVLFAACYDQNGRMLGIQEIVLSSNTAEVSFGNLTNCADVRIFGMDTESLVPAEGFMGFS